MNVSTFQINSTNPYAYLDSLQKIGNRKRSLWSGFELDLNTPKSKGNCQVFIKEDFHFYRSNYQIGIDILLKGKKEEEDKEYIDFRVDNFGRTLFTYKEWQSPARPQNEKSYHIFLKKKILGIDEQTFAVKNHKARQDHRLSKLSAEILSILPTGNKNALLIESKILEFIYTYLDYLHAPLEETPAFLLSDYHIQCLHDAKSVLEKSYTNPPIIERLSKTVGINSNQLKLGFKHLFGITIRQFVIDLRLHHARQLILETSLPLGHICQRIGYHNHGHFSKLYKNKYGISPLKDRSRARGTRCSLLDEL